MDVLTPRSLDDALRLKSEHPDAVLIQGGTDVMVALNFDRLRPETVLNLNEVRELRGWSRTDGSLRLGAGLTYDEALRDELAASLPALAEASRTVGSPQIRNRGTIGGNLGTASPAGDALPPLLVEGAEVELASVHGERRVALQEFLVGPKRNALADEARERGATITKIAAMAATGGDRNRLLDLLRQRVVARQGMIVIAMGPHGAASRVFFPLCGSLLTYGFLEEAVAPGQLSIRDLRAELARYCPEAGVRSEG